MTNLSLRSNINVQKYNSKDVYIYEDHRYILNILYSFYLINKKPLNLITFDKHDDFKDSNLNKKYFSEFHKKNPTIEEFWSTVEWKLSGLDDDWIKTGMELNLINDIILIDGEVGGNLTSYPSSIKDINNKTHYIYRFPHIWNGLNKQGWLVDTAQTSRYKAAWDILDWNPNLRCINNPKNFIVDFDLDYFSYDLDNDVVAWPRDYINEKFNLEFGNISTKSILNDLFSKCEFITIAKESECTGSIKENNKIMDMINYTLFKNKL